MRIVKLLIAYILFMASISLSAQNVGIDEPNPSEKLDVNGRIVAKGYKNTIYEAGGINAGQVFISQGPMGPNFWQDFPDLSITFTLDTATTVLNSYKISMSSGGGTFMVTRLVIDNVVVDRTVYSTSSNYFYNNSLYVSELAAGSHTIKVQFRTNGGGENNPAANDWHNRFLQILVWGG